MDKNYLNEFRKNSKDIKLLKTLEAVVKNYLLGFTKMLMFVKRFYGSGNGFKWILRNFTRF